MMNLKYPPLISGGRRFLGHFLPFRKNPYLFFQKHCKEHAGIFMFTLIGRPFIVLNHPEAIKHVLVSKAKNYSRKSSYQFLEELLGEGLLTTEGDDWRKKRRLSQPTFSKEQMEGLIGLLESTTTDFIQQWSKKQTNLNLDEEMNQVALALLTNSVIQSEMNDQTFKLVKDHLETALFYLTKNRFNPFKWQKKLPSLTRKKGKKSINILKDLIKDIVDHRSQSNQTHTDLLAMLISAVDTETGSKLNNIELMDEVMTMFVAGHDTTSVVLTWTIFLLGKHPEIQQKLLNEIDENHHDKPISSEYLKNFTYLKMVINESMRLYPPVWAFGRKSVQEDEIMGYHIPKGVNCNIPVMFMHRNSRYWEKPNEFYPEHFLEDAVKQRDKFAFIPFSGGEHRCIGEYFALMEVQIVLIHLLRKFKISVSNEQNTDLNLLVTIKPKHKIHISLSNR